MQVIRLDLERGGFLLCEQAKKPRYPFLIGGVLLLLLLLFFREMMCQNGLRRTRTMSMLEVANTFLTPVDL